MAKTNYRKMSTDAKEDVTPVVETPSFDVVEETAAEVVVNDEPQVTMSNPIGVVIDCEKLNVRAEATVNSKIVTVIKKGTEVEITGSDGDFYCVTSASATEGFNGYCMKKYISIK